MRRDCSFQRLDLVEFDSVTRSCYRDKVDDNETVIAPRQPGWMTNALRKCYGERVLATRYMAPRTGIMLGWTKRLVGWRETSCGDDASFIVDHSIDLAVVTTAAGWGRYRKPFLVLPQNMFLVNKHSAPTVTGYQSLFRVENCYLWGWQQPIPMLNTGLVPVHCPELPKVEGGRRKSLYKVDARRYFIPCGYTWRATGELRDLHLIADRWFKFLVASPVDVSPYRDWPGEVLLLEQPNAIH